MPLCSDEVRAFEDARGRLEAIAYRLLGSTADAEDAVQETFLRWQAADRARIQTPEAWLTKVIINVCLNLLTSARARRESYVGQWLPEPVLAGDRMLGPAETAEQRASVSMAVLTLMERLSARERVVYVLRMAFGYEHGEIARILDITEANSQQIHRRARQHVATGRPRVPTDAAAAHRIVEEFLAATLSGDTAPLVKLLTADATSVADGGGRVPTRRGPIVGALGIARFLRGLFRSSVLARAYVGDTVEAYPAVVNGGPALLVVGSERIAGVFALDAVASLNRVAGPPSPAGPGMILVSLTSMPERILGTGARVPSSGCDGLRDVVSACRTGGQGLDVPRGVRA